MHPCTLCPMPACIEDDLMPATRDPWRKYRALQSVSEGMTYKEAALIHGISQETLIRWSKTWITLGFPWIFPEIPAALADGCPPYV